MSASPLLDPTISLLMARCASAAYLDDADKLVDSLREGGMEGTLTLFQSGDTEGFVCHNEQDVFVIFRGSASVGDWLYNAAVDLVPWSGPGRVHEGFLAALEEVWKPLDKAAGILLPGRKLWLAGHSLGGALAMLAAEKWRRDRTILPAGIFTFGAPKVGDQTFAMAFDQAHGDRAVAFLNHGDPIPWLPILNSEYASAGLGVFFDKDGRLAPKPGPLEAAFLFLASLGSLSREEMLQARPHKAREYARLAEKNFKA